MAASVNQLFERLTRLVSGERDETPPEEHRTVKQWAKLWKCDVQKAYRLVLAGQKAGLMDSKKYTVNCGKVSRPVPHYFEVEKKRRG